MATASLVVKISADINDFSRKLNSMTKDVVKASDRLADVGKTLTLGLTVPIGLAAVALGKLGMENEAIANRMSRQFGPAVEEVNAQIEQLMKLLPVTNSELSNMAMGINNTMRGMGMAADASAKMSTAMIQMAGDLAATTGETIPAAMDALEQAMQGRTRGLKAFGVVIDEASVKQEAYKLGILGVNRELTPLGKSLAVYSLLLKQSGTWQGQATERMKDAEYQWQMLKTESIELAEAIGNTLVPMFRVLIGMARAFVDVIADTPPWLVKTAAVILGLAAAVGPLLFVFSKLIGTFFVLRTAIMLLMGPAAMGGLMALLANPVVLGAIIAIGVALAGAAFLWKKYKSAQSEATNEPPKMPKLPSLSELMKGAGGLDEATGDPLQNMKRGVDLVKNSLERAVKVGDRWIDSYQDLLTIQDQSLAGMMANIGKTNEWAEAYAEVYDEVTKIINAMQLMEVMQIKGANVQGGVKRASMADRSDLDLRAQVARNAIDEETQLRMREQAMKMASAFNVVRTAAVELAEEHRRAAESFSLSMAKFKGAWANAGQGAKDGAKAGIADVLMMFTPFGIVLKVITKVLEGLMPFIEALFEPLVMLGKVIGVMLTPILKILFIPLKYLALVVAFLGEIIARVSGGIATAVGQLVRAVGKAVDALPFISAKGIIKAGDAILDFARSQYEAADELNKMQKIIKDMEYGASDGLDTLTDAANQTAEALLNIPSGFRIALARYNATQPDGIATAGMNVPQGAMRDTPLVIPVMLDGKVIAKSTVTSLQRVAQAQFGTSNRWAEVQL